MIRKMVILLLILFTCISVPAQNPETIVKDNEGAEFLPYAIGNHSTETNYDDFLSDAIPENWVKLYDEKMEEIIALFSKQRSLNPPTGFEARFNKRIDLVNDQPVAWLEMSFSPYFWIDQEKTADFHISSILNIYLNDPSGISGAPVMADIFSAPQKIDEFFGYPIYLTNMGEVTWINFTDEALLVSVSQEDFLHVLINFWEQQASQVEAEKNNFQEEVSRFNSDEEAQQRQADFEKAYDDLLKIDKNAAEELRKAYQEVMNIKVEQQEGEEAFDTGIMFARQQVTLLQEELAALTPEERNRQAYYSPGAMEQSGHVSGLLPEESEDEGDALVRMNPQLFQKDLHKIQLLTIRWSLLNKEYYDKPRLCPVSDEPIQIIDNKMLSVYQDAAFWSNLLKRLAQ
ncbi:MAG: hypothetical protein JXQ65_04570 [Candidatus Marinimicrobia bacterium]|nr:hypothetical protein [Candidatus Neomarinimicrobiota bacterium]